MTDSWRRSDKKNFEFGVSNNRYYYFIQSLPTLIGIPAFLAALFFFNLPRDSAYSWLYVIIAVFIMYSGGWFARKYACGKLKITVDDEGMNFEWLKQVPFRKNVDMRILFTEVTAYAFEQRIFYSYYDTDIVFYNGEKRLVLFNPTEPFKWWNAKNDELAFYDFLSMKSQLLKDQNIFQLDWDRSYKSPFQRYWRKRKLKRQAGKLSSN